MEKLKEEREREGGGEKRMRVERGRRKGERETYISHIRSIASISS